MRKNILLTLFVFLSISSFLLYKKYKFTNSLNVQGTTIEPTHEVLLGDTKLKVAIADSPDKLHRGLSNYDYLPENYGMLFIFPYKNSYPTFWMKDMKFPIDIIWIDDEKIVQIDRNLPVPKKDVPDEKLLIYKPSIPVDYVLEVNSGFSKKFNIVVGKKVEIQ